MTTKPTHQAQRETITRAVLAGLISGTARALLTWILDRLSAHL